MQKLAAVLLTILATHASAFQGRPVSDLRFEGQAWISSHQIASDGVDFLALSTSRSLQDLFTQKIVDGHAVGPHRQIGSGKPAGLVWTGSEYLAASIDEGSLWVTRVSRDGSPLSTPAAVMAGGDMMTGNHRGALVFRHDGTKIAVQRLDPTGTPVGGILTYDAPPVSGWSEAGPAAGGFGVTFSGSHGVWLMTFREDGSAITTTPVLLDGPYPGSSDWFSGARSVATNGTDTVVVFGVRNGEEKDLKSAVVGADGSLKSVSLVYPGAISTYGLVWDGSQYTTTIYAEISPGEFKPALLRIASNGDRIGEPVWISVDEGSFAVAALATNGRDWIVPLTNFASYPSTDSFYVTLDAATLTTRTPAVIGRTLTTQRDLTLVAAGNGYLAAWFETVGDLSTLRVSRIDAAGNYLDGTGVVVETLPPQGSFDRRTISIDTHGPRTFIVWTAAEQMGGRFLSAHGLPQGATVMMGSGHEAAVLWDGTQYIVLHSDSLSLYSTLVSASGVPGETKTIAEYEYFTLGEEAYFTKPSVVMAGNRPLAVYGRDHYVCGMFPGDCMGDTTVMGLFLDAPDAVPFTIAATPEYVQTTISVAASPSHLLVSWMDWPNWAFSANLRGTLLDAGAPEQGGASFSLDQTEPYTTPAASLAFDGHDFIAAWWRSGLRTARITTAGTIHDKRLMSLRAGESGMDAVVAASAAQRPLAGFIGGSPSYDSVLRGVLVLESEIGAVQTVPSAPSVLCTTRTDDQSIRVSWEPVANVRGIAVELQLPDGTFRMIGVAPSGATAATVPLAGLDGSAVRLRAWNGFGLSEPSAIAPSLPAPAADVHAMPNACAGAPVEVTATLTGTPPFVVRWSDGVMQTVSEGFTVTRLMTLDRDTRIAVDSVTDASCEAGTSNGGVDIQVTAAPLITQQSRTVRVSPNQPATLNVVTATHGTRFAWYEGVRGDTARPVGRNDATFTTPPATRTMQYWVRLTTSCGTIDSDTMTVSIDARRRAARK